MIWWFSPLWIGKKTKGKKIKTCGASVMKLEPDQSVQPVNRPSNQSELHNGLVLLINW